MTNLTGNLGIRTSTTFFNVSHSGDYALYAFTRHYEVGIDLECINKDMGIEDIILTVLSPSEKKAIRKGWLEDKIEDCFDNASLFERTLERVSLSNGLITYPYSLT